MFEGHSSSNKFQTKYELREMNKTFAYPGFRIEISFSTVFVFLISL